MARMKPEGKERRNVRAGSEESTDVVGQPMGKNLSNPGKEDSSEPGLSLQDGDVAGEKEIMRAWEDFLAGMLNSSVAHTSYLVRTLVVDSWSRSRKNRVDAHCQGSPAVLNEEALYQLRQRQHVLCKAAGATLAQAAKFLAGTGSMMILTDPDGVVLETVGDQRVIESGQEIHLLRGGGWSEAVVGTNAIGTAMATGRPVQVHAAEHFCEGVKKWTCAASPIRDPADSTLVGVLDISGPKHSLQPNNLALAVTAAMSIQAALTEESLAERAKLLDACLSQLPGWLEDAVIALDRRGRIIHMNENVHERLDRWSVPIVPALGMTIADLGSVQSVDEWPQQLPPGLRPEWFKPVRVANETLGSLLVIPHRPRHPESGHRASAVARGFGRKDGFGVIIGRSRVMKDTVDRALRLAANRAPILIQGETGVGKELFARTIHASGVTSSGPFVVFNCGAVSRELVASELFGYVKGAFTGAHSDGRAGRFELADGGTLCLDEISEMPLDLQPYLLRVLEDNTIYRLGANKGRRVDVRLIALTNRNLRDEIAAGHFRKDLFYRISVTTLDVPPLRAREDDIDLLVDHFNQSLARRHGIAPKEIDSEVRQIFWDFDWPGNVRELRNLLESLLLMTRGDEIGVADLPPELRQAGAGEATTEPWDTDAAQPGSATLERSERRAIEAAVRACAGNLTHSAATLGISRTTLYQKLKKYRIDHR